jgi:two-component system chemotaxis response regulator CheB
MATRLVVVGASWGGLRAVATLLEGLPPWFEPAVVVVQHRGPGPSLGLADALAGRSALPVVEATDKEPIRPGHAYLAPPDYHLLVERDALVLSIDEPEGFSRPSIDVLFESAADAYGAEVAGVLLTGASDDGANGLQRIRRRGGVGVVQDPETAERRRMPDAGIAAGGAHRVLPIEKIAAFLVELSGSRETTS